MKKRQDLSNTRMAPPSRMRPGSEVTRPLESKPMSSATDAPLSLASASAHLHICLALICSMEACLSSMWALLEQDPHPDLS